MSAQQCRMPFKHLCHKTVRGASRSCRPYNAHVVTDNWKRIWCSATTWNLAHNRHCCISQSVGRLLGGHAFVSLGLRGLRQPLVPLGGSLPIVDANILRGRFASCTLRFTGRLGLHGRDLCDTRMVRHHFRRRASALNASFLADRAKHNATFSIHLLDQHLTVPFCSAHDAASKFTADLAFNPARLGATLCRCPFAQLHANLGQRLPPGPAATSSRSHHCGRDCNPAMSSGEAASAMATTTANASGVPIRWQPTRLCA
mmetsp:Transcript_54737/g.152760  ORF Transcript_54737/g.152760 Transcript_54737/m.152760 type:complete len:258 (+) Transcript_54737:803-1576(+)